MLVQDRILICSGVSSGVLHTCCAGQAERIVNYTFLMHSVNTSKQNLCHACVLLLLLQASVESYAFFPSMIEAGRLRITEKVCTV